MGRLKYWANNILTDTCFLFILLITYIIDL